jgi:hypothetical protein
MTVAPSEIGRSLSQAMPPQAAAGAGYISLTMMAPSGTGASRAGADTFSGRFTLSHRYMSGEYQTSTGACVPFDTPDHLPF